MQNWKSLRPQYIAEEPRRRIGKAKPQYTGERHETTTNNTADR